MKVLALIKDINAINISGKLIPMPKKKKVNIFSKQDVIVTDFVNRAAIKRGLQGITISPKNNPYIKALRYIFVNVGI